MIILPNTLQDIFIAIICMIIISLLLIPSVIGAILITLAIVSINVGLVGFMTWWSVNLDAISMISVLMSVGFAVDLSAHITYAFTVEKGQTATERAISGLEHMGYPVVQGALATLLGVSALATVDAYTIVTFFKTIFIVLLLGLLHGLVLLPVILKLSSDVMQEIRRRTKLKLQKLQNFKSKTNGNAKVFTIDSGSHRNTL